MNKIIDWEKISMNIIATSGEAKSYAMEAIYASKKGDFKESTSKMKLAEEKIAKASHMHFEIIQEEAKGKQLDFKVLFMHAEDQLLTTQTLIILAKELIDIHKKIRK